MLFSIPSWRLVLPLGGVGLILLLISLFLVGRDVAFARQEAEREVVAFAEAGALALQFTPTSQVESYLAGLLKHPAIATATVYSSNGARTTSSRPPGTESPFIKRFIPTLKEPVVGCRVVGSASLCLEADMAYYHQRLAALLLPHGILLAASWLLLMMALVLGAGSNRRRLAQLSQIIKRAIDENNYSLRALEGKGQAGDVSRGVNRLLEQMHQRDLILRRRSTELETANRELEAFAYSVSHDLRSPLASVEGFSHALSDAYGDVLDDSGKEYLRWIRDAVTQMTNLVAGLLQMSRLSRMEINRTRVDLSAMAHSVAESLRQTDPTRSVEFSIEPRLVGGGDERLLHAVLENLMSNAFKYSRKKEKAIITVGSTVEDGRRTYFVKDNGAGFDSTQAARMFTAFQRLHSASEFEGTGIGLSTVKRILERHGGAIWADGQPGQGATFYFTLGDAPIPGELPREVTELTEAR